MKTKNPDANPAARTRTAYVGELRVVVQELPHGYAAYMLGRSGQRAPISYGAYRPTDLEDALEAAVRSVKAAYLTPRTTRPYPLVTNSPQGPDERGARRGRQLAQGAARRIDSSREGAQFRTGRAQQRAVIARAQGQDPRTGGARDPFWDTVANPGAAALLEDAKAKFEEFHRKAPTKIGEFARGFSIPKVVGELGKAIHVLYRSMKKDPSTGKQPKKPVDYIHDHYAGVKVYEAANTELAQVEVPAFILKADALVLLGSYLGCRFECDGDEHDCEGTTPLPELYCTPCGKALLVIQDKRELLQISWGGSLGVWARGIDG